MVRSRAWPAAEKIVPIRQVYLNHRDDLSVRVRSADGVYSLTLKAGMRIGVRQEFEWPIPAEDGRVLMERLAPSPPIEKHRHIVRAEGRIWEVDVFSGRNEGMIIAETELEDIDEPVQLPAWLGPEVTHDPRFSNNALYRNPFGVWGLSYEALIVQLRQS